MPARSFDSIIFLNGLPMSRMIFDRMCWLAASWEFPGSVWMTLANLLEWCRSTGVIFCICAVTFPPLLARIRTGILRCEICCFWQTVPSPSCGGQSAMGLPSSLIQRRTSTIRNTVPPSGDFSTGSSMCKCATPFRQLLWPAYGGGRRIALGLIQLNYWPCRLTRARFSAPRHHPSHMVAL